MHASNKDSTATERIQKLKTLSPQKDKLNKVMVMLLAHLIYIGLPTVLKFNVGQEVTILAPAANSYCVTVLNVSNLFTQD